MTPSLFNVYDRVLHVKTGRTFTVVGTPDRCRIEAGWVPAYAYLEDDGMFVVRPQAEMEDGRFVVAPESAISSETLEFFRPAPEGGGAFKEAST